MIRSLPDLLTAGRLFLSPLSLISLVLALAGAWSFSVPLALMLLAAASDLADGRLARRLGTVSLRGKRFDAVADIAVLLPSLALLAYAGFLPLLLPAAVTLAFSLFAANLFWFPERLRGKLELADRVGHLGGIGNWVACCLATAAAGPLGAPFFLSLAYDAGVVVTILNLSATLLHLRSLTRERNPLVERA